MLYLRTAGAAMLTEGGTTLWIQHKSRARNGVKKPCGLPVPFQLHPQEFGQASFLDNLLMLFATAVIVLRVQRAEAFEHRPDGEVSLA